MAVMAMRVKTKFGADVSVRPDGLGGVVLSISIDGDSAWVTLSKEAALALSALLATTATEGGDGDGLPKNK